MRRHASAVRIAAILIALADIHAQTATVPSSTEKTAVDALIPWLLQEDAQLRGIPFSSNLRCHGKAGARLQPEERNRRASLETNQQRAR